MELEAKRDRLASDSALTAEQLAAIDEITLKLRQTWGRAHDQARSILTAEQLAKLYSGGAKPPSFETDGDSAGLSLFDLTMLSGRADLLSQAASRPTPLFARFARWVGTFTLSSRSTRLSGLGFDTANSHASYTNTNNTRRSGGRSISRSHSMMGYGSTSLYP
jgi:hypothetical protein